MARDLHGLESRTINPDQTVQLTCYCGFVTGFRSGTATTSASYEAGLVLEAHIVTTVAAEQIEAA